MVLDSEFHRKAESELGRVSHIAKQTLGYYREPTSAVIASLAEVVPHTITICEQRRRVAGVEV